MRSNKFRRTAAALLALCLMLSMTPGVLADEEAAQPALQAATSEKALTRGTWQNAAVVGADESVSFVLDVYNSSFTADQIWLAVNVAEENQAIQLRFSDNAKKLYAYVYSAETLRSGNPTSLNCLYSCYTNTNDTFSCCAPAAGVYYIMVKPESGAISDTARKLTISFNDGDHNESNDTWQTATELTQNVNTYFNLHGSNDVDWFKLTTTIPGEAIHLVFSNFDYTVDPIAVYLYSVSGDTISRLYDTTVSTNDTVTYKVNTPGDYYVRIKPEVSDEFVMRELKLRYELLPGDGNELNDTHQTATTLVNNVNTPFTLNGGNDVDWFYFETTEPNQLMYLYITGFETDYSNRITYTIYDLVDGELSRLASPSDVSINVIGKGVNLSNIGGHYIKITPDGWRNVENTLQLRIDLQQSQNDGCEPNDTWQEATPLVYGAEQAFTLPAYNDIDWFCFTVDESDQTLALTFASISSGGRLNLQLYSAEALELSGSNADSLYSDSASNGTYCWMLGDAGTYYVRTRAYSNSNTFSDSATIHYELIEPDSSERNNTWKTAAAITEEVDTAFTLPAYNDRDWFKFTVDEPNQTMKLTFSNVPSGGKLHWALYSGQDLTDKGDSASALTSIYTTGSGSTTYYWMLGDAGTYYVKVWPYGEGYQFSDPATIRYELIQPDSNEPNGDYTTATPLAAGSAAWFSLPASNDYDWFALDDLQIGDRIEMIVGSTTVDYPKVYADLYVLQEGSTEISMDTGVGRHTDAPAYSLYRGTVTQAGTHYLSLRTADTKLYGVSGGLYVKYTVTRDAVSVSGITLLTSAETLPEGKTLLLNTKLTPYYASNQYVTWHSSDPTVATVDNNGMVTTLAPGETTVTVTAGDGGYSASCAITVVSAVRATGVTLDQVYSELQPKSLALDTSLQLRATLAPEDTTNRNVTWVSSDPKVLAVTNYGKVTAIGSGKASITVTTEDGGYSATTWFSVPDESYPVTRVLLDKTNLSVYMNEDGTQLTASVRPTYATNPSVTWSSDNERVAVVDQNGVITAVSEGYATITVTAAENPAITADCRVAVLPQRVRVTGLSFEKASLDLGLYTEVALAPIFAPDNATVRTLTWSSSNKNVATVSRTGKVSTLGLGYADITATSEDGGFTATIRINVSPSAEMGDVNNDGAIDAADALMILQHSVDLRALTTTEKALADVSNDAFVDAADAILILRYAAGLIDEFPNK